jgi:hypothetical protein
MLPDSKGCPIVGVCRPPRMIDNCSRFVWCYYGKYAPSAVTGTADVRAVLKDVSGFFFMTATSSLTPCISVYSLPANNLNRRDPHPSALAEYSVLYPSFNVMVTTLVLAS